jgi:hypothetical protein
MCRPLSYSYGCAEMAASRSAAARAGTRPSAREGPGACAGTPTAAGCIPSPCTGGACAVGAGGTSSPAGPTRTPAGSISTGCQVESGTLLNRERQQLLRKRCVLGVAQGRLRHDALQDSVSQARKLFGKEEAGRWRAAQAQYAGAKAESRLNAAAPPQPPPGATPQAVHAPFTAGHQPRD